jgi:hypothetical protein
VTTKLGIAAAAAEYDSKKAPAVGGTAGACAKPARKEGRNCALKIGLRPQTWERRDLQRSDGMTHATRP